MDETEYYLKFYDDEAYLLDVVGPRFLQTGELTAPDFYMLLVWKANRAKNFHRARLKSLVPSGVFQDAVAAIAEELYAAEHPEDRLRLLMTRWGFYLPTASAILTLLWPEEFTVYDYRVCELLGWGQHLAQRDYSDALWTDYQKFLRLVEANTPEGLSLRDKDRWLTGKSYREDVERECGL